MRLLKWIGTALLFVVIALCLAPTVIPPFLDRIYYEGAPSGHFDGERFFNPGGTGNEEAAQASGRRGFLGRFLSGDRARWPERVAVAQSFPPAAATPCPTLTGAVVENWRRCADRVDPQLMAVTWIGHATVLIQTGGLNILTDPIWSDRASPVSFAGPKRVRAPGIRFEDLPKIDLVVISHNHYDHMDLPTLKRLWERDRPIIVTSLGNDTILRRNGIAGRGDVTDCGRCPGVEALDWGQQSFVEGAAMEAWQARPEGPAPIARVMTLRNHHWSSRWGSDRNRALWSGFVIETPGGRRIFFAGDTGWGDGSWVRDAAALGPYRLAIIPIGAYEPRDFMKTHHINPEEAVRIFEALDPVQALGVHWGTFQLTFEPIDEPRQKLEAIKRRRGIPPGRFIATEAGRSFSVPGLPARAADPDRRTAPTTSR